MFYPDEINNDNKEEYEDQLSRSAENFYSDARYSPADDSTSPPRYYVPPKRSNAEEHESEPEPVKKEKALKPAREVAPALIAAMCLLCSTVGGAVGALYVEKKDSARFDELESKLETLNEPAPNDSSHMRSSEDEVFAEGISNKQPDEDVKEEIPPADIYSQACSQVVGITTEVTYSNFFGQTSSSAVSGSGFVIKDGGYILTNYHVIEYADKYDYRVSVMPYDGTVYDAEIIGVDEDNDLAVLKVEAPDLTSVTFGNSNSIQVGDLAYAVGNPLGELEFTMTSGTVSALDRYITAEKAGSSINMFQIDAAVNTGNSGGPVYNSRGEVIGVVTAKYSSDGVEGIGFAIPSNDAFRIATDIITNGYVTGRAYLGVLYDDSTNSIYNMYYKDLWNTPEGVMILQVEKNSCAARAGIQDYDTIVSIDEHEIAEGSDLVNAIRQYSAGDTAVVTVYRAGDGISEGSYYELSVVFDEATPRAHNDNMSAA